MPEPGREQGLACWSSVLALDMTADALLRAVEDAEDALARTRRWRPLKRRTIQRRLYIYQTLYWVVATKAQEEDSKRD
jgi:hypothetical protein